MVNFTPEQVDVMMSSVCYFDIVSEGDFKNNICNFNAMNALSGNDINIPLILN